MVGYIGKWLEPRFGNRPSITSIRVREVCFEQYSGSLTSVADIADIIPLNGCIDSTKTSQVFREIPAKYVSPGTVTMT